MNYKELFNKMAFLLSSPGRFWEKEAAEGQGSRMMSEYVYPLIGLCGLSEFIGTFIGRDVSSEFFQWALTRCCAIAVSLFGGFFVAVYLLDKISWNLFNKYIPKETLQVFVGYSMTVLFVLDMVNGLISIEILHWIFQLYTVAVVFEGARRFLEIPESKLTSYTVVASILILLSPVMIEFVFNKLSVILN